MNPLAHRLLVVALLAFAVAYTFAARTIPLDAWTAAETINTRTLPTIYGLCLILALALLLWRTPTATAQEGSLQWSKLAGLCGAIALFTVSLSVLNLWIALALLLAASAWWLGERRWTSLALLAALVPLGGFVVVEVLLGVYVP